MKIIVFAGDSSYVVNAPDGTYSWSIMNPDGSESRRDVERYVSRTQDANRVVCIARFREVDENEMAEAISLHS